MDKLNGFLKIGLILLLAASVTLLMRPFIPVEWNQLAEIAYDIARAGGLINFIGLIYNVIHYFRKR